MPLPANAEEALARSVLGAGLGVRPGELVTIETWSHALPWALALVREARRRGADPILFVEEEETFFRSLRLSSLRSVPGPPPALASASDAYVYLPGPEAYRRLLGLSETELAATRRRHGAAWWAAARRHRTRIAVLAIGLVTPGAAARFRIDLDTWRRRVYRASLVPPASLDRRGRRLAVRLNRARVLRVKHSNGTDLVLRPRPGETAVDDGHLGGGAPRSSPGVTGIPGGLIRVPLSSGSVEGTWESNRQYHDRFLDPPISSGSHFEFHGGRLEEYTFEQGGLAFTAAFPEAVDGMAGPTELTIGLNPVAEWAPEVEEISAGTLTLWFGAARAGHGSYGAPSFGSLLAGAELQIDGRLRWRDGRAGAIRPTQRGTRTGRARRTIGSTGRPARGGGERSARR